MKHLADFSIASKLVAVMLLTSITALLLSSLMQAATEGLAYRQNRADYLQTIAELIGTNSVAAITFGDARLAHQVIGSLKADSSISSGSIISPTGEVLARYQAMSDGRTADANQPSQALLERTRSAGGPVLTWDGLRSVDIVRPIGFDGEVIGYVYLRASLDPLVEMLTRFLWMAGAIAVVTVILVVFLAARLQRVISTPILALAKLMQCVTRDGDYSLRAEKSGNDEVGTLIEGFNNMLTQISDRDQRLVAQNLTIDEQARGLAAANQQLIASNRIAIEARDAAEAASRAKSQFLARMSHEIRTPMNGVLGMTELLLASGLEGRRRHFAETIQNSADTLLTLINDILDFSKIEAGKLELERTDFDLRQAVESTVEALAIHAQGKDIELLCDFDPNLPTSVAGDATRLRQVLTNLVANAIKFTDKGEVLVRARGQPADTGRYRFRFEVVDTGIGIRPENQAMIFQLFSQEDGSTTRRYGGTGLGLAICRQLVELMGGEIGVESEPARGSTFWFTLPLDVAAQPAAQASSAGLAEHLPLLALVVDDNATNREILQLQLQAWGVTVEQADSAAAALRCLEHGDRRYDFAILDWHMPEVCGLDLARMIRADERLRHLRLIMLSSGVADDGGGAAREAGIDICINKPVRQARLLECIIRALTVAGKSSGADLERAAADDTATMASTGGTVLLVEDNPVNREVATTMLQTLGCRVDSAVNGQEAVTKIRREEFDLVLMDCEMPVMDGYAATAAIRAWEAGNAGRRVPILALTAHAMPEHRRRCLDVGMDDYLTKPFNMGQLRERIARWLRVPAPNLTLAAISEPVAARNPPGVSGKVVQFQALESIASLDPANGQALVGRLLEVYEASSRELVDQIAGALARQQADGVRKAAHALRSSSGNVGAERLVECCRSLETAARAGDFAAIPGLVDALLAEHRSVIEQLRQWQTRKTA